MMANEVRERPGPGITACDKLFWRNKGICSWSYTTSQAVCLILEPELTTRSPLQERTVYKLGLAAAH